MAWNDLTISQRSQLMNVFRQNGVTSLSEMRRLYDLSSPLVETTDTTKTNAAPVFRAGGKRKANMPPQGVSEGDAAFVGPSSKHLMVGPEVPYGFNDAPIDWERKKALQHYTESSFLPNQVSRAGAAGPYQIMPRIWNHYKDKLGLTGSPQDYNNSEAVRDTMMEGLLNAGWVNKNFPSDSVRAAKAFMGYNWGSGNATNFLEDMKRQGVDIYHSMDWIDKIPNDETRNYVNYILRERNVPGGKTIEEFEKALPHRFDAFPEAKHADGGFLKDYRSGGHLFWPGGPMNLTPYIPKVIAKGYGVLKDVLSGNPEKQKRLVEKYHENADKMPAWAHRVVYDTVKDTAFSGNMEDIPINFIYNAFSSRPNIDNTFLLDPERQKQELEKLGFHQVDTSKGYGLVNSAVKKYKDATGRDVPMYQIGEDDEVRENLVPLNNFIYSPGANFKWVVDERDPETGMIHAQHTEIINSIGDTASTPTRYYRDSNGNLYIKQWDFFDHGNYSRRDRSPEEYDYESQALSILSNEYGNLMDVAGNPFVKTTGYTRVHPDAISTAISDIVGIDNYYNRFKENSEEILKAIKNGEFDIKAHGGKIHINPENRGKFNATKERTGKTTEELTHSKNPLTKKRAIFAQNAAHWSHKKCYGGIKF